MTHTVLPVAPLTIASVLEDVVERLELAVTDLGACTEADGFTELAMKLAGIASLATTAGLQLVELRAQDEFERAAHMAGRAEAADLQIKDIR